MDDIAKLIELLKKLRSNRGQKSYDSAVTSFIKAACWLEREKKGSVIMNQNEHIFNQQIKFETYE